MGVTPAPPPPPPPRCPPLALGFLVGAKVDSCLTVGGVKVLRIGYNKKVIALDESLRVVSLVTVSVDGSSVGVVVGDEGLLLGVSLDDVLKIEVVMAVMVARLVISTVASSLLVTVGDGDDDDDGG